MLEMNREIIFQKLRPPDTLLVVPQEALGRTHITNGLNLGIGPERGGEVPGLPKLFGALFIEGGNCLNFSTGILQWYYMGIVCDIPGFHWIFIEQT